MAIAERFKVQPEDCWTVKQLKTLAIAESLVYYKGNLDRDIESNTLVKLGSCVGGGENKKNPWTGIYVDVLRQIRNCAQILQRDSKLQLWETEHSSVIDGIEVKWKAYHATRLH
jgi:hypothetical protein